VELFDVELRAEDGLGLFAGAQPGEVANLVAAGLADRDAIAFDLALDSRPWEAGGLLLLIDGLLAAPALGVEAGVDD
jgi:hypothetical protein